MAGKQASHPKQAAQQHMPPNCRPPTTWTWMDHVDSNFQQSCKLAVDTNVTIYTIQAVLSTSGCWPQRPATPTYGRDARGPICRQHALLQPTQHRQEAARQEKKKKKKTEIALCSHININLATSRDQGSRNAISTGDVSRALGTPSPLQGPFDLAAASVEKSADGKYD